MTKPGLVEKRSRRERAFQFAFIVFAAALVLAGDIFVSEQKVVQH